MTVFKELCKKHPTSFATFKVVRDNEHIGAAEFVSFPVLSSVLVSRWYPGYRKTDLTGPNADEAIALLLGDVMQSFDALEGFRRTLATPAVASEVINRLFPRGFAPIKNRVYQVTENKIAETTRKALQEVNHADEESVVLAYAYAITRVLAAKGLVAPAREARIVKVAEAFVVGMSDLKRTIMVDGLRGIFSEARIQSAIKHLDSDVTPLVLGEMVGEMFRHFSMSIPEVVLRLEHFEIAIMATRMYNLDPQALPTTLRAHLSLQQLASIANFTVFAHEEVSSVDISGMATADVKAACDAILTVVRSAPSVETIPLSTFPDYFGEVPTSSPDGFRRGIVLYSVLGQKAMMDVADVYPLEDGANVALVDSAYVKASGLAAPLTTALLTPSAMGGLANIVADEMSLQKIELDADCMFDPELLTIQVTEQDIFILALARATSVSYIRSADNPTAALSVLFECNVAEQWRMAVLSATPSTAFFTDAASVVVYTSKMLNREPRTFPARDQTIGLRVMDDAHYLGDVETMFSRSVEEPFTLQIPVTPYGDETTMLKLEINVLGSLVGYGGKKYNRDTAYYASVAEPGVDREVETLLQLALAYAELPNSDINGDKARSWLVVRLAPLMMHPSVRLLAERAVNKAILESRIDGRRLAPQLKEVYTRAFFGTVLAILNRFNKVSGGVVTGLTKAVPTSTLSVQASLTLAQLPSMIHNMPVGGRI